MSIPHSCFPDIEAGADALEAWWQPCPRAFKSQEASHAFATHEIDSRRTATKLARMDLSCMWTYGNPSTHSDVCRAHAVVTACGIKVIKRLCVRWDENRAKSEAGMESEQNARRPGGRTKKGYSPW